MRTHHARLCPALPPCPGACEVCAFLFCLVLRINKSSPLLGGPEPTMSLPPDAPDWAPVPAGVSHIAGLLAEVNAPGANQGQVR